MVPTMSAAHRLEIRRGAWVASDEQDSLDASGVEIIAPTTGTEEYMHLDAGGRLVHRVSGARSYLARLLGPLGRLQAFRGWAFALRALERMVELEVLYGRRWAEVTASDPRVQRLLAAVGVLRKDGVPLMHRVTFPDGELRSADLVCCTYNRVEELLLTLPTLVREAQRARQDGIGCRVIVVHQNEGFDARILEQDPSLKGLVEFSLCLPPGLTRARNQGASLSTADLVIFVDDDVLLDEGFVHEHLRAANAHPTAVGVAGRIKSRGEGPRKIQARAIGQLRPTGHVDAWFDSEYDARPIVPLTPRGANMAFRRRAVNALLGPSWFDESLDGSAHREETTCALALFRAGGFFVYAPRASLYHFEAVDGGCENRKDEAPPALRRRLGLEYLFLNRLYSHDEVLRALGPLGLLVRELLRKQRPASLTTLLAAHQAGFREGRRRFNELRDWPHPARRRGAGP
jgi:GT2 family glycosyltransferase